MRFRALLLVTVVGVSSVALGQEPDGAVADGEIVPAYAPLAAVAYMPESGQVLLYSEDSKRYELARVGDKVGAWKIVAIEDERVVVVSGSERDELSFVPAPSEIRTRTIVANTDKDKKVKEPKKLPETVVTAPETTITEEKHAVTRAELDRELGNFDSLMATVEVSAQAGGGFVMTRVDAGSWVYKMGLRTGDIVRSVAAEQVNNVEDAARVYARLKSVKSFDIELDRAGKRMIHHYDVHKGRRP